MLHRFEDVPREFPMMRTLFGNDEVFDLTEPFPDFGDLGSKQFSKEWTNTDVGKVIATSSNRSAVAGVVAMLRMIERLFHEPGERLWAALRYFSADKLDEFGLNQQTSNAERPTSNDRNSAAELEIRCWALSVRRLLPRFLPLPL